MNSEDSAATEANEALSAGRNLPDFSGRSISDIEEELEKAGFKEMPKKPNASESYRRFCHEDKSEVNIDTVNKQVKVQGPRKWASDGSGKYPDRVEPHNQPYEP